MNEIDEGNLRDMLELATGEPPHWVSLASIRQRGIRRRVTQVSAAGLAAVLVAGIGATLSAYAARGGGPAVGGTKTVTGPPRYYVQQDRERSGAFKVVVRARSTGKVTSVVRYPKPGANCGDYLAAAGIHTFFMVCQVWRKPPVEALIYRFEVSNSGRATTPVLIKGGTIGGNMLGGQFAASPDGSHIAIEELPANAKGTVFTDTVPIGIAVINTKTGKTAMWRTGPYIPGKIGYTGADDISFTRNGSELVLNESLCHRSRFHSDCTPSDPQEVRAFGPADKGGSLQGGQILLRLSAFKQPGSELDNAFITPDGAALTSVVTVCPRRGECVISAAKIALTTGKVLHLFYRARSGNRSSYYLNFFAADPTARFLIISLGLGPNGNDQVNGWIDNGRLVPLTPAAGDDAGPEAW